MFSGEIEPGLPLRGRGAPRSVKTFALIQPVRRRIAVDPRRVRHTLAACPEIDCLRDRLAPGELAAAELRAAEIGIGADRSLICDGAIDEQAYVAALASHLGLAFDTLDGLPRSACPLDDERLIAAAAAGLLPLDLDGGRVLAVAPRGLTARWLANHLGPHSELFDRVLLTTPEALNAFVAHHAAPAIGHKAVNALRAVRPDLCAGTGRARTWLIVAATLAVLIGATATPGPLANGLDVALAVVFLGWTVLRLVGIVAGQPRPARPAPNGDDRLPIYTVIVALYREAAAVRDLVAALSQLAYPREKLDIKLVVEPDDFETRAAIAALRLGPPFEVVVAPQAGPRTKPKALNAALPFARGAFTAVFDAEDRPEPGQLRLALHAFLAEDDLLACVQARLTIDNTRDSWLTRLFTADYAGLFDVFLPGISALQLPLPLGGSSNHFRTAVLRKVGAWDPYNMTEDADLGMRLARAGYRTAVIGSTTYEEAPARFAPWLRQRTRWFKGWFQTWIVHMRRPFRLLRQLGLPGFLVFQLVIGGTVLAALVHPVFVAALAWQLAADTSLTHEADIVALAMTALHGSTLIAGYAVSAMLGFIGLARRRLLGSAWVLLLMPLHWLLLSLAAWRALAQLVRDPYRWEKTEHGLARTSRLAKAPSERQRYRRF
jgi:cellulose synthase/poly-beta-1,6-N-acetylglucosamine synthase-like glycosyltransferase